jgi:hypothetical protein
MTRKTLALWLFALFLLPATAAAFDLYVRSVKAPVYLMPDTASGVVAIYEQGAKLAGIESKDNWHMIRVNDGTGWVYRFLVGDKPPLDTEAGSLADQYTDHETNARRRPSSYTTAAAARGLRDRQRQFAEKYALDYEALEKIEAVEISREELMSFVKQGLENEDKK